MLSISFTTYGDHVNFANKSLNEIFKWKNKSHQLIVACHDPSEKMSFFLNSVLKKGLIDELHYTPSNFGHLKGVNFCLRKAKEKFFFNINHDILIKNISVIDECLNLLKNKKTGMVGWFWVGKGCYWDGDVLKYTLRNKKIEKTKFFDDPSELKNAMKKNNVKNVVPNENWIWCCNTSFFGIRTDLFNSIGGFNQKDFKHGYADDYITYQLLEKKYNILNLSKNSYKNFDSLSRCKWHRIGIKLSKKSKNNKYLPKLI